MNATNQNSVRRTWKRIGAALAFFLCAAAAFAQSSGITQIVVPGATSFSVSGLNANGQVAGYFSAVNGAQRAFFWSDGNALDLGTLGGSVSVGNGLNNFGEVVGYSSTVGDAEFHAFLSVGRTLFDLGTLGGVVSSATAVNDSGRVTGYSFISRIALDQHAFLYSSGVIQDLGTLGGTYSVGLAINATSEVTGESRLAGDVDTHAFLFSGGTMRDLGTFGGSFSSPKALNDLGEVTGEATTANEDETHAFLFSNGVLQDLGTLGGTWSSGWAINDLTDVIGDSALEGDTEYHGFIFRDNTLRDLGTLGGNFSSAWALNNFGQVVGVSANALGQRHAFIWENGSMSDLNSFLPADSGWDLNAAYFINDASQVVGTGLYQGQAAWFLMTVRSRGNQSPVPSAGSDQLVECAGAATVISLDGSASNDPDGDALTFEWLEGGLLLGSTATLNVSLALGSHTLTLRVTDSHNASAEDTVVITVRDTTAPSITCPPGQSASAGASGLAAVPDFLSGLVVSDNCSSGTELAKLQNPTPGTLLGCGTYSVTLTVVDTSGNRALCTTTFSVADLTAPLVDCPASISAPSNDNGVAAVPDFLAALDASDNCTPAGELVKAQSPAPGTLVGCGTHVVTVTVTDTAGNRTACTITFTVADATAPAVQCPDGQTAAPNDEGLAEVPNFLTGLLASDNCTTAGELLKSQTPAPGTLVSCGTHVVTLTVVDAAGNRSTCTTTFTVQDTTPPVVNCPSEITRRVNANCQTEVPDLSLRITASDNCTPADELVITQSPAPGTLVDLGDHEITVTVTDASGNATTCTVLLHAVDKTAPHISSLTANPEILSPANHQMVSVTVSVVAADNCDPQPVCQITSVTSNEPVTDRGDNTSPDWNITGALTVELRAEVNSQDTARVYTITVACTDASGNTCTKNVQVRVPKNKKTATAAVKKANSGKKKK